MIAPRLALTLGLALTAVGSGSGPTPPPHLPGTMQLPPLGLPPPPAPPAERERGVALGIFAEDVSFSYGPLLAEIVALGATHVALVVPLYQTDGGSDELSLDTRFSPTLGDRRRHRAAGPPRRAGGDHLPDRAPLGAAPGRVARHAGAARSRRLVPELRRPLGDLAGVAAATGATRLVVGSELSTLDGDLARWRPLIEKVRGIFNGKLVYSANWDHYQNARALRSRRRGRNLRLLQPARGRAAPDDDATAEAGWRRVRQELEAWRAGRTNPFIFTELGYRSRAGATAAPWDEGPGGKPDPDEQRRGFAAFRRAWTGSATLDGVYVWNWYGYGGPATTGYTPRGKPAETEVRALLESL